MADAAGRSDRRRRRATHRGRPRPATGRRRTVRPLAVADGRRAVVGRRAHRRHLARHLLDRRVAPGRRHPGLPRPAAVLPAPPLAQPGHGAGEPDPGRPPGGPGPDRRPGRRRAAPTGRVSGHRPPHPREGERRGAGRRAGRRPRPVPILRIRDGDRRHPAGAGRGLCRRWSRPPVRPASSSASCTANRTPPSPARCPWAAGCREPSSRPGFRPTWPPPGISAPPIRWSARPASATRACSSVGTSSAARSSTTRSSSTGSGVVTNPNMVVFGQIGRGKSSFVKSYLWRQAVFGRQRLGGGSQRGVRPAGPGVGRRAGGPPARGIGPAQSAGHRGAGRCRRSAR